MSVIHIDVATDINHPSSKQQQKSWKFIRHFLSSSGKMSATNRAETDSETSRKPVVFNDETLPVISCKEIIQKDPVYVLFVSYSVYIRRDFLSSIKVIRSTQVFKRNLKSNLLKLLVKVLNIKNAK